MQNTEICQVTVSPGPPPPGFVRRWFDALELSAMRFFARLWHGCTGEGQQLIPASGPCIVIANHRSNADPAFLLATSPRPLQFLQAQEYFDVWGLRRLFRVCGCIPVARDRRDVVPVRRALAELRLGKALALFPEGDVIRSGQAAGENIKHGAAYLALRSSAPVIPARIIGGPCRHNVLGDWLLPSAGVHVVYGPPIDLAPYHRRRLSRSLLAHATAQLMEAIDRLPSKQHRIARSKPPTSREIAAGVANCIPAAESSKS